MLYTRLKETFLDVFGKGGVLYAAPGSLVLLGEQADELKGFAIAGAVDRITAAVAKPNGSDVTRLFNMDIGELDEITVAKGPSKSWSGSLYGVMKLLRRHGLPLLGFDMVIGGVVPHQACFSGYSALTTLGCLVLNEINRLGLSRFDLVKLAQEAEEVSTGQFVGIVHPFVSLFGQTDRLIRVNCHTLEYEYLSLPGKDSRLVILDASKQAPTLMAEKALLQRHCRTAFSILHAQYPALSRLADVNLDQLEAAGQYLSDDLMAACRYVLTENACQQRAYEALTRQDLPALEVTIQQAQEALAQYTTQPSETLAFLLGVAARAGIIGSRALGLGMAGCTLHLVDEAGQHVLIDQTKTAYRPVFDREIKVHRLRLVNGAGRLSF